MSACLDISTASCYPMSAEGSGLRGAFPVAPIVRPRTTATFSKSAALGSGPRSLEADMRKRPEKPVPATCEQCGRGFLRHGWQVARGVGRFCSNACKHAASRTDVTLQCLNCGRDFIVPRYRASTARFCSKYCQRNPPSAKEQLVCPVCGARHSRFPSEIKNGRRFCSQTCAQAARPGRIERICEHCGRAFVGKQSDVDEGGARFCSRACWAAGISTRVKRTCVLCGRDFLATPSAIKSPRRGARFCSRECYFRYVGTGPSGPELILARHLQAAGLTHEREATVGRYRVDFLLEGRLAVEVDSEFWHSLPGVPEKDERKDRDLEARGLLVLRVPADVVVAEPALILAQIREVLDATA